MTTGLNDYRPVALTSVVMEKLVLAHLKDITGPSLDPLQFAYRANRSVDDAVNMGLHYVLQHLDFSLAFNNIIPNLLLPKLTQRYVVKKAQQRLYFLRQLRKFNLPQELLKKLYFIPVYTIVNLYIVIPYLPVLFHSYFYYLCFFVLSLTFCCTSWHSVASVMKKKFLVCVNIPGNKAHSDSDKDMQVSKTHKNVCLHFPYAYEWDHPV